MWQHRFLFLLLGDSVREIDQQTLANQKQSIGDWVASSCSTSVSHGFTLCSGALLITISFSIGKVLEHERHGRNMDEQLVLSHSRRHGFPCVARR